VKTGCRNKALLLLIFFASLGGCLFTLDSVRIEDERVAPEEEEEDETSEVIHTGKGTDYEDLVSRSFYRSTRGPLGDFSMFLDG
jgi:hypothetical protein